MLRKSIAPAIALALLFAHPALSQDHSDHGGMEMAAPKGDQGPSSKAFAESNARMHAGMDIDFSGNADVDFVRGMIAHHQGAIEMAQIQLQYGKDEQLRRLAQGIIVEQQQEIATMRRILAEGAERR